MAVLTIFPRMYHAGVNSHVGADVRFGVSNGEEGGGLSIKAAVVGLSHGVAVDVFDIDRFVVD